MANRHVASANIRDRHGERSQLGPLTRDTATPLHDQISALLRAKVDAGDWPEHYKLHAEEDLAAELEVSRGTIRRALRTLIEEGLLKQVQGRGTFVTGQGVEQDYINPLRSMAHELATQGVDYSTELISFDSVPASQPVTGLLDLSSGDSVWEIRRVRRGNDGEPLMVLHNWVSQTACPQLTRGDVEGGSLLETLEAKHGVRALMARRTLSAALADDQTAAELDLTVGDPVLLIEQLTYTASDRPLERSEIWVASSRLRMSSIVRRNQD